MYEAKVSIDNIPNDSRNHVKLQLNKLKSSDSKSKLKNVINCIKKISGSKHILDLKAERRIKQLNYGKWYLKVNEYGRSINSSFS